MPGTTALGKLFFKKKLRRESSVKCPVRQLIRMPGPFLIVRKIIRLKSRRWSKRLVAVDHGAVVPARSQFVAFLIRGDERSAARGQAQNQSSILRNTDDTSAYRATAALRRVFARSLTRAPVSRV